MEIFGVLVNSEEDVSCWVLLVCFRDFIGVIIWRMYWGRKRWKEEILINRRGVEWGCGVEGVGEGSLGNYLGVKL